MHRISVAICTHNPRPGYLSRVLNALRGQTLPCSDWELVLVDNASKTPVAGIFDLSWHPGARVVVESKLGIASARIRAIKETTGELLVFLDDDNVAADDYLERCLELYAERQDLGAVSGCIMPEYEMPPPEWFGPYESWIAVRRITRNTWSNFIDSRSEPVSAGMCLRKKIADAYVEAAETNPVHRLLGRSGTSLISGEDIALAKIAIKLGYSVGQFTQLRLLHLIPKHRIEPQYLFSLYRHIHASGYLIGWVDSAGREPVRMPWRVLVRSVFQFVKGGKIPRRLVIEQFYGFQVARKVVRDWRAAERNAASPVKQTQA